MMQDRFQLLKPYLSATGRLFYTKAEKFILDNPNLELVNSSEALSKVYCWVNDCVPGICSVCGKLTKFKSFYTGFAEVCSRSCSAKSESRIEKTKATLLKLYGVTHQMRSPLVVKKFEDTCIEKYGVSNPLKSSELKIAGLQKKYGANIVNVSQTSEWRDKTEITFKNRYGGRGKGGSLLNKIENTCLETYGHVNPMSNRHVSKSSINTKLKILLQEIAINREWKISGLENYNHGTSQLTINCKCGSIFNWIYKQRQLRCYKCDPNNRSGFERKIYDILVDEFGIPQDQILVNDRKLLKGKELDIYLPNYNLAIEVNGLYWHSSNNLIDDEIQKIRHLKKTEDCLDKNVRLIHLFEHEIENNLSIIKGLLRVALKIPERIIDAKDTNLVESTYHKVEKFFNDNNFNGSITGDRYMTLEYQNDIVGCAVINGQELKTCFKSGYVIKDGLTKMICKESMIYVVDRSKFTEESLTGQKSFVPPDYCYWNKKTGELLSSNQINKSAEDLYASGWRRFWDCGQLRIELT